MFERFTTKARKSLVVAQDEAARLKHNFIGTEHILLGLAGMGDSVAGKLLESLGLPLEKVREQVRERVGEGAEPVGGHIPFTPKAKKVLELSLRESLQLGHNYIGTEHVLLALIREHERDGGSVIAGEILETLDTDLHGIRHKILETFGPPSEPSPPLGGSQEAGSLEDQLAKIERALRDIMRALEGIRRQK